MKKLLSLVIILSLAFVMNAVAQDAASEAPAAAPMVIETVIEDGELGVVDACGPVVAPTPCGPYTAPCRPFVRRGYARPCPPQPCCEPFVCAPAPRHCMPRRAWGHCPAPCPAPCFDPCVAPCVDPCDPCGYPGFRPTPVRNFFARLFAPRCGYGYDPCCEPCGYGPGYGYGPYGY